MAFIYQGILGPFIGKVGPSVGYLWRGKACVRAYRRYINYPNTPAQQTEKDWFVAMVRFAAVARPALKIGFLKHALEAKMTECNYFVRENKRCFSMEEGSVRVDYSRLTLSRGSAADVFFKPARFEEGEVVSVDFEKNAMSLRASSEDRVYVYAYCPESAEGCLSAPVPRRSKCVSMRLPESWSGKDVHLYGFVEDREGRTSNTTYIGMGRVNHYEDGGRFVQINKGWTDFVDIVKQATGVTSNGSEKRHVEKETPVESSREGARGEPPEMP